MWLSSRVLFALSTGHKVGLAVVGGVFIAFALGSSLLFPRFRPQFPGHGLKAFIVVAFVFFFGMMTAVEVFGAEPKEKKAGQPVAESTSGPAATTTAPVQTTAQAPTTTKAATTTTAAPPPKPQTVQVTEKEFNIILVSTSLKAGPVTFQITNTGAIAHDLAIVGGPKSQLIPPKGSGTLTATLKGGPVEFYCTVPGHKAAGMDLKVQVAA
jgi:nitrite reductase (NO-forming)